MLLLGGLMLMIGVAFKLAAVPFHFWAPDVFEGAVGRGRRLPVGRIQSRGIGLAGPPGHGLFLHRRSGPAPEPGPGPGNTSDS